MSPDASDLKRSNRVGSWLAARPLWGGAVLALLIGLAVLGAFQPPPAFPLEDGVEWTKANETSNQFGLGRKAAFIAVFAEEPGGILAEDVQEALRAAEARVEALPWVGQWMTPWDVPGQRGRGLSDLVDHPLAGAPMLGPEGRGLLGPVFVRKGIGYSSIGRPGPDSADELVAAVRGALDQHGAGHGLEVGVTGEGLLRRAQQLAFQSERWGFMGMGALLGFLIASVAFRSVRATFLAGLPPLLGVVVATGLARLIGLGSDGFTSIVLPLLVLTIGFTDSLHIVVAAVRARQAGARDGGDAARIALSELTWPCALTSLTTAIGFASLATAGSSVIVDFGLSCALATISTFVCVIVSIPLLARTPLGRRLEDVRPPNFDGDVEDARVGPVARFVASVTSKSLRAPRSVALLGGAATVILCLLATGLGADRRSLSDLAEGTEAVDTLRRVDAELGGIFPVQVRLDWDDEADLALAMDAARRAAEVLRREPLIQGVHGPAELIDAVGGSLGAMELLPDFLRGPWLDASERRGLVHARIPDAGSAALIPVFKRVREGLMPLESPGLRVELVGGHIAYLETVDDITGDLRRSLGIAAVLILLTLGVAFRSWRLGLASVVPNLLPIGAAASGLYLVDGSIDVSTLTALTLSLGIATDDTIHVLARWTYEERRGIPLVDAARQAVLRTLPALTLTTLTLAAAFGQLLVSAIPTIRQFGLLAATTLAVAFFADVWLLPAALVVTARRRPANRNAESD